MLCEFKYKKGQGDGKCIAKMIDNLIQDENTSSTVVFERFGGRLQRPPEQDTCTPLFWTDKDNFVRPKTGVTVVDMADSVIRAEHIMQIKRGDIKEDLNKLMEDFFIDLFRGNGIFFICHRYIPSEFLNNVLECLKTAYKKVKPNCLYKSHLIIVDWLE